MQGLLQVDDDLAVVAKHQRHHAPDPLVVNVYRAVIIDAVATGLNGFEQDFRLIHEFWVGHYNFTMLQTGRILVTSLALVASAGFLGGCGQAGSLYLPSEPAAAKRATLPQTLVQPASRPASAPLP